MINRTITPTDTAITAAGYRILLVQPIYFCTTVSPSELMDVGLKVKPIKEWAKYFYLSILTEFPSSPSHSLPPQKTYLNLLLKLKINNWLQKRLENVEIDFTTRLQLKSTHKWKSQYFRVRRTKYRLLLSNWTTIREGYEFWQLRCLTQRILTTNSRFEITKSLI